MASKRLRLGVDIALAVLFVVVVLLGAAYWYLRAHQPDLDGAVRLAGLSAPVEIVRDTRGIPHITARNVHDLYLAQGFAMAQDRLWQMDLMRRLGEGRLAEVFGPVALQADRENRELGLAHAIAAEAGRLQPQEAALLDAFATGVNDYLTRRGGDLPLEFRLLHYRPEAWKPEDSLALAGNMYQVLAMDYKDKIERESFAAKIGSELTQQLFPDRSPWDIIPGAPPPALFPRVGSLHLPALPVFAAPPQPPALPRGGSNNWVLSGAHSLDGAPLLANDPHLQFQVPGLWWAVELSAPQFQAAGVAIVGVPGVIIGHNQHIAWGVTNADTDAQDLYRETLDGHGNVLTAQGWQPLQHWRETIPVQGQAAVPMDILVTPHGPIVAHDSGGPLALAWTLYAPGALQAAHVFLGIEEAQNWQQFEAALAEFAGPAQNFVYADTAGHIGYQCAGWVPQRHGWDGSLPLPGAPGTYDWHGWVPFANLPRAFDPPGGVIATANGRIAPDDDPYPLSTDWDAPNRTRRIYGLLSERPRWNAEGMARIQTDVVSEQDGDFAQALLAAANDGRGPQRGFAARPAYARPGLGSPRPQAGAPLRRGRASSFAGGEPPSGILRPFAPTLPTGQAARPLRAARARAGAPGPDAATRRALALLHGFHGAMDRGSIAATLAYETRQEFLRRVIAARAGAALAQQYDWNEAPVFEQWLLAAHPAQWLPPRYAGSGGGWDALLLDSLTSVADRNPPPWGRFETLEVDHPVYAHIPLIRDLADLGPVEINGSPLTVKQARNPALGEKSTLGPSMRMVDDLAAWDHSTLTLVAGESGEPFRVHYRDEFADYLSGTALPLWFSPAAVAQHAAHRLRLLP